MISPIWLKYFQFGPIEWVWRNLSYQKVHPFRKTKIAQSKTYDVADEVDVVPVQKSIVTPVT